MIGFSGKICAFNNFFYVVLLRLRVFYFLRSIGTLKTLIFLRSNTKQLSKSPDIYTSQNVSDYATVKYDLKGHPRSYKTTFMPKSF